MYWMPAVDGASAGPDNVSVTGWLSTEIVSDGEEATPAALIAEKLSDRCPSG
jgi:hypothetical protein